MRYSFNIKRLYLQSDILVILKTTVVAYLMRAVTSQIVKKNFTRELNGNTQRLGLGFDSRTVVSTM